MGERGTWKADTGGTRFLFFVSVPPVRLPPARPPLINNERPGPPTTFLFLSSSPTAEGRPTGLGDEDKEREMVGGACPRFLSPPGPPTKTRPKDGRNGGYAGGKSLWWMGPGERNRGQAVGDFRVFRTRVVNGWAGETDVGLLVFLCWREPDVCFLPARL